MRGLLRSGSTLVLVSLALGACSQVIGISGYEIDPALDEAEGGKGGSSTEQPNAGEAPVGGSDDMDAGGSGGQSPEGGEGGEGGGGEEPDLGCKSAADCDDDIGCTVDVCLADGTCRHTADDAECDPLKCQTCQAGVGCVAGSTMTVELLTDPGFDGTNEDWVESSNTFDDKNIFPNAMAQTAPNVASFGPAVTDAEKQEYADLFQYVIVPERTVGITLSGYYKLTPGAKLPEDDYVVAAFYELSATDPTVQFHSWAGDEGAQAAWKSFTYSAPKADIPDLIGNEYSFDLVGYSWESVYYFDSLKLTATVCE